jgi:hypothetical protein
MVSSTEVWEGDDDLARQRRKRQARVLDEQLPDSPALTIADVVADVLAASESGSGVIDVRQYLADEGHHWRTIEAVAGYMQRYEVPEGILPDTIVTDRVVPEGVMADRGVAEATVADRVPPAHVVPADERLL